MQFLSDSGISQNVESLCSVIKQREISLESFYSGEYLVPLHVEKISLIPPIVRLRFDKCFALRVLSDSANWQTEEYIFPHTFACIVLISPQVCLIDVFMEQSN